MKHIGENVVRIEADALRALADRIAGPMAGAFDRAVELLHACTGRVVVTGMGKSGIIARKIAATLSSTGTPALFMHPVDAVHGDLGMVVRGDVVLALSASGETEEILALLATIKRLRVALIAMTGDEICGGRDARNSHPSKSAKGGAASAMFAPAKSQKQGATVPAPYRQRPHKHGLHKAARLWRRQRTLRSIVLSRRRLARWAWRLRLRLRRCWRWATLWR